jgi:hypothetical protein
MFKKADLIVYLLLAAIFAAVFLSVNTPKSEYAVVYYQGKQYARYSLKHDKIIKVDGKAEIVISDGQAYFKSSSCDNQLCVKSGYCKSGHPVICAPNGIILRIEGGTDDIDGISY